MWAVVLHTHEALLADEKLEYYVVSDRMWGPTGDTS